MSIQELIEEANTKLPAWKKALPEGLGYGIWYEGEDFEAWVEKVMHYLDENFKDKPQTVRFYKLYTMEDDRKDYHRHKYFMEMMSCLEELSKM